LLEIKLTHKFAIITLQGYSRSSILVPIERSRDFLLAIDGNFSFISHRVIDTVAKNAPKRHSYLPPLIWRPL